MYVRQSVKAVENRRKSFRLLTTVNQPPRLNQNANSHSVYPKAQPPPTKQVGNLQSTWKMKSSSVIQKLVLLVGILASCVQAFAPSISVSSASIRSTTCIFAAEASGADPKEIIGKTITVKGNVNGGYVRTCIVNEVSDYRDKVPSTIYCVENSAYSTVHRTDYVS